jgi:hypothetical protein
VDARNARALHAPDFGSFKTQNGYFSIYFLNQMIAWSQEASAMFAANSAQSKEIFSKNKNCSSRRLNQKKRK